MLSPSSPVPASVPTGLASPEPRTVFGHPRPLFTLFLTEMWERFSYYGMRALLFVFMITPVAAGGMGYTTARAGVIYGTYTMCVYMLGIPGGYVADNFLGAYRSVWCGAGVIALGHFALAWPSAGMFFTGLALITFGTGLLKPNISTMVGSLYAPGDPRRDSGFSIFYMGINLGAAISPLVTGYLAQSTAFRDLLRAHGFNPTHSWHWGFASAGVGMMFGLALFLLGGRGLRSVGAPRHGAAPWPWRRLFLLLAGTGILFALVLLSDLVPQFQWLRLGYIAVPLAAVIWFGTRADLERRRLGAIGVFVIASIVFWAVFEQSGSTIALFAEQLTDRTLPHDGVFHLLGLTIRIGSPFPSAWFQSINSVWIIVLAPVFAWWWLRMGDRQPSSPAKFVWGLAFLALSFLLMVPAAQLTSAGRVSPWWLVGLFLLQTIGELCLSPVGLSTMTKLAPPRLLGLVMGVWFLAMALGNKVAGVLAGELSSSTPQVLAHFFLEQFLWVAGMTIALLAAVPWVKRLMGEVR